MSQQVDPRDEEIRELRQRLQGAMADNEVLRNRLDRAQEIHAQLDRKLQEKTNRVNVLEGEKRAFNGWHLEGKRS